MFSQIKRIFTTVLLFIPITAFTQNVSSIYFDQKYWSDFDWENAEKSRLWNEDGYIKEPSRSSKTEVLYKQGKEIQIESQPFYLSVMKWDKREFPFEASVSLKKKQNDSCKSVNEKLTKAFGVSSEMSDNSRYYVSEPDVRPFEYDWQWDVGKTRVTLQCGSFGKEPDMNEIVIVSYQHLDNESKIESPIHLTCSKRAKATAGEWVEGNPINISVLPYVKVVTNADRAVMAKITTFSNSFIKFVLKKDVLDVAYTINRIDGSLVGTGSSSAIPIRVEGVCEVRDPNKRKF